MSTNGASGEITVTFTHPRSAKKLKVAIGPSITGEKALEQLRAQRDFLPASSAAKPHSLMCERTSVALPMATSLIEAGVQSGDVLIVTEVQEGHGRGAP